MRRRRIKHERDTVPFGKLGKVFDRLYGNLKLREKKSGALQKWCRFCQKVWGELAIGSGHDHDVILTVRSRRDQCNPRRSLYRIHVFCINTGIFQSCAQLCAEGVVPHVSHHRNGIPEPGCRDCLVRALSPVKGFKAIANDRLPNLGNMIGGGY